jgi:intein-encoded DNA endonuclease-like protein
MSELNHQNNRPNWGKITRSSEERRFLEGPRRRLEELARAIRIFMEFIRGFGPCTSSARA